MFHRADIAPSGMITPVRRHVPLYWKNTEKEEMISGKTPKGRDRASIGRRVPLIPPDGERGEEARSAAKTALSRPPRRIPGARSSPSATTLRTSETHNKPGGVYRDDGRRHPANPASNHPDSQCGDPAVFFLIESQFMLAGTTAPKDSDLPPGSDGSTSASCEEGCRSA